MDHMQALADKATPGPWLSKKGFIGAKHAAFLVNDYHDGIHIHWGDKGHGNGTEQSFDNAAFVAAARSFVPAAIARIKELQAATPAASSGVGTTQDEAKALRKALQKACVKADNGSSHIPVPVDVVDRIWGFLSADTTLRSAASPVVAPQPWVPIGEALTWLENGEEYVVLTRYKGKLHRYIFPYYNDGFHGPAGFYHPGDEEGGPFLITTEAQYGEVVYVLPYPELPEAPAAAPTGQATEKGGASL
ncbi:hypothetical protein F0P96_10405 [Hymenobacter busanensis]|uniref:Uncharacterized protein n=1 Tax=Hymenobacter busanensis TaxID=2607656 RepID=A0A7L5A2F3_9BACT|nr:hypothetical protein [Hymenobacter busanensis]KAA9333371.1 hypothetical protein F0P96_10405 [Hymenobacter busanensis]QHJ07950.1 hypothetical protein GUY19_11905 [Hymenobacter busanensis]